MKMPKGITNHKAVKYCVDGDSVGFDYKYNVELHEGWVFAYGRNAGSDMCNFNNVEDFKFCNPIEVDK